MTESFYRDGNGLLIFELEFLEMTCDSLKIFLHLFTITKTCLSILKTFSHLFESFNTRFEFRGTVHYLLFIPSFFTILEV